LTAELPRRFYTSATVADDGAGIMLDARRPKTPRGAAFSAPTRALAEAMAAEWAAQGEHIVPSSMPVTQLAFAAVDHTPARRDELVQYIAKFGEADLVCHRAASPAPLVARQSTLWDPMIVWAGHDLGVMLPVVTGVVAAPTSAESRETLAAHTAALDDLWSQAQWGEDAEAQDRLDSHRAEFENIARFIALLG
jgi:chaperone required for assembly of F1-ATPase